MSQKPFPPPYAILTELLVAARLSAGVTQKVLAERLSISQSSVSKVERGVQRLDLVELHHWLSALGEPSLADFAIAFEDQVRRQTAVEQRWLRRKRGTVAGVDAPRQRRRDAT
ncbi:MAG: helix-turn-helix transcriptional regulator [Burkholderiaceae bacterium]|nr:helix-turn-helix transcriptional regulator [Burkholderiaceae bacterium]